MEAKHWLDYLTGFGAVATPLFVLVLTGVGWRLRKAMDRRIELEDKLREDRVSIYNVILEPFMLALTSQATWDNDRQNKTKDKHAAVLAKMLSWEYRKTAFKLSLIANDSVVRAYNELMQHFFSQERTSQATDTTALLRLLGTLLLEIRKSMGNEATQLNHWEMLEWLIKDIRSIKRE